MQYENKFHIYIKNICILQNNRIFNIFNNIIWYI